MIKTLVPDSNVFAKLFLREPDSEEARVLFKYCIRSDTRLLVPELFKYEIAAITIKCKKPLDKTIQLFDAHASTILTVIAPDLPLWEKAAEISHTGHIKSGFPSLYDSIYHALAMQNDTYFITADLRHYEKTKHLGSILPLNNWESLFSDQH